MGVLNTVKYISPARNDIYNLCSLQDTKQADITHPLCLPKTFSMIHICFTTTYFPALSHVYASSLWMMLLTFRHCYKWYQRKKELRNKSLLSWSVSACKYLIQFINQLDYDLRAAMYRRLLTTRWLPAFVNLVIRLHRPSTKGGSWW